MTSSVPTQGHDDPDAGRSFSYAEALAVFYGGEVEGEAFLSAMIGQASDPTIILKLANLLQMETETKAMLRAPMVSAGLSVAEPFDLREKNHRRGQRVAVSWEVFIQSVHDQVADRFLPLYQRYADAARARGLADEIRVCDHMVDHEAGLLEFIRRELDGEPLERVLEPLRTRLRHPI